MNIDEAGTALTDAVEALEAATTDVVNKLTPGTGLDNVELMDARWVIHQMILKVARKAIALDESFEDWIAAWRVLR